MRFQGKGAGAGMMLSSSMGPMGIAIGVAIDEGIGKDIQAAADDAGFDVLDSIQDGMEKADTPYKLVFLSSDLEAPLNIALKRYGYKTHTGKSDLVTPSIEGSVSMAGKTVPLMYLLPEQTPLTLSFEEVKNDGKAVNDVFEPALHDALNAALLSLLFGASSS